MPDRCVAPDSPTGCPIRGDRCVADVGDDSDMGDALLRSDGSLKAPGTAPGTASAAAPDGSPSESRRRRVVTRTALYERRHPS